MSYILDALRKAEAERERGSVPSIHAQPSFAGARPGGAPAKSRVWIAVLCGAVVTAVVVLALLAPNGLLPWTVMRRPAPASPVVALSLPVTAPALPVTPPTPPFTTPASLAAAQEPAPLAIASPATTARQPAHEARPLPAVSATASAKASATASASTGEPQRTATKSVDRVYGFDELPEEIRRQLPALTVGGSLYSTEAASRLVIINGQVLHEGEHITPDLVVQQIRMKTALLEFKGYRYTLVF